MKTTLVERVRRANASPGPEDSVVFRVATSVSVLTAVLAAWSVGELSIPLALGSVVAVTVGMTFSYLTRRDPWQWLKILLALAVIVVFAFFVQQILGAAHTGELDSIEVPLAGLFTWVQVVHSFDVPARRDLLFSLAAGGALLTIAGAQAVSAEFVVFVAVFLAASVTGLSCSWHSIARQRRAPSALTVAGCLVLIVVCGLVVLIAVPSPRPMQGLTLPSSLTSYVPLSGDGLVNGLGPNPDSPAQAGKPGGQIGIGGYEGFGRSLDTADRATLGDEVLMRVRADRPGYFLGLTYDHWSGQSWTDSFAERGLTKIEGGSPFQIPAAVPGGPGAPTNVQTFYVERNLENMLFATSNPVEVYFPDRDLLVGKNGSLLTTVAMTPGTVYTVISADDEASPKQLAGDRRRLTRAEEDSLGIRSALELPYRYSRVSRLSRSIVARAHAVTTMGEIDALEAWIASHTEYTTDIPPLRPGEDAVDEFLFGNRRGYCEQISTALAVMLRTLGIPTREAIGYVPGPFDPLSDTYAIEAKDAHAWVQVYFPGYGWQSFDPTADVPLAPENPGSVLASDLASGLARLPWLPIGSVAVAGAAGYGSLSLRRRLRRRPATWAGRRALVLEQLATRRGILRGPAETLDELAARIDREFPAVDAGPAARVIEMMAYGCELATAPYGPEPGEAERHLVDEAIARLRAVRTRRLVKRKRREPSRAASAR